VPQHVGPLTEIGPYYDGIDEFVIETTAVCECSRPIFKRPMLLPFGAAGAIIALTAT
jgi:hypothetical protein